MEQWKPVPGYEGIYEASDAGRVRSVARTMYRKDGTPLHYKEKVLRPYIGSKGYPVVGLCRNGKSHTYQLHRIIAKCFVAKPDGREFINHKDGDKGNCAASNLEWVTASQNAEHAYRVLGIKPPRLGTCGNRFTADEVRAIRKDTRRVVEIAAQYGVTRESIYKIKNRKTYSIIED